MKITIKDARNFIEGNFLYFLNDLVRPAHITEQALFRAFKCYPCLRAGKCIVKKCGCKTPNMFYARLKTDPGKKWGAMLGKGQWDVYRQTDDYKRTLAQIYRYVDLEKFGYDKELLESLPRVEDDSEGREGFQDFMGSFTNGTSEKPILQSSDRPEVRENTGGSLHTEGEGDSEGNGDNGETSGQSDDSRGKNSDGVEKEDGREG